MGYKYLVIDTKLRQLPIIFPDILCHVDVARAICVLLAKSNPEAKAVSAGDIGIEVLECSGESETLGLTALPTDKPLIDLFPIFHGVKY